MKLKKILIVLIVTLVGIFSLNVSLKAHNNMDNSNQVIPSTDMLIGDIYIPRLFEFSLDEATFSYVENFQGGLPDYVNYNYVYNGINRVGSIPFFTENGVQLFSQYASSFRFIVDLRVFNIGNNIDYNVKIAFYLPYLQYFNNYPIYNDIFITDYEYNYGCLANNIIPFYILDNDNRTYEQVLSFAYLFTISSSGLFDSDEVHLDFRITETDFVVNSAQVSVSDIYIEDLYVDFYIPNEMLAKNFGIIKFDEGYDDGWEDGFYDGSTGDNGVFSSISNFLSTSVGGFFNFEIFPGWNIGDFYLIIIGLILLVILLKLFMGG